MPRPDWCYIFDNIRLVRTLISQPGLIVSPATWCREAPPPLSNACCNYSSQLLGSTRQVVSPDAPSGTKTVTELNFIPQLQWFLFYGGSSDAIFGPVPYTPSDFDTSLLNPDPLTYDSLYTPPSLDPTDLTPPSVTGWCLAIVLRNIYDPNAPSDGNVNILPLIPFSPEIAPSAGDLPNVVQFTSIAMYALTPPDPIYSTPPDPEADPPVVGVLADNQATALFNCSGLNSWSLTYNPLQLPTHTIQTIPIGP